MSEPVTVPVEEEEESTLTPEAEDSWRALDEAIDEADYGPTAEAAEVEDEPETEDEAPAVEAKTEPAKPETPPAQEVQAEEPEEPAQEEPTAEAEEEESEEEEPQVQAPPPPDETQRQAARNQAIDQLVSQYQLSEDDASALQTEPEKVFPRLAAELHLKVYEQIVPAIMQNLAPVVQGLIKQTSTADKREEAFFGRWPQLRKHKKEVGQIAQMWRQMNPEAKSEVAMEQIGRIAVASLGISPGQPGRTEEVLETPPPPPPPAGSPAVSPQTKPQSMNPFEAMADAWNQGEDEYF